MCSVSDLDIIIFLSSSLSSCDERVSHHLVLQEKHKKLQFWVLGLSLCPQQMGLFVHIFRNILTSSITFLPLWSPSFSTSSHQTKEFCLQVLVISVVHPSVRREVEKKPHLTSRQKERIIDKTNMLYCNKLTLNSKQITSRFDLSLNLMLQFILQHFTSLCNTVAFISNATVLNRLNGMNYFPIHPPKRSERSGQCTAK